MPDDSFLRVARDQRKSALWAAANSTRDVAFFVSLKGQTVSVTTRWANPAEPLTGVLSAVVFHGGDQNAGAAGIVIEEPAGGDGTAVAHYLPVDALALVSFRVLRRPG